MTEQTCRIRNRVAILLACNRTRVNKARWLSIQSMLQRTDVRGPSAALDFERQLATELDYLNTLLESSNCGVRAKDAVIMNPYNERLTP
jgi:hypothetical protein